MNIATQQANGQAAAEEWITLAEASRITGKHPASVKSIALAGGIRPRVTPGARILYSKSDAERIAIHS
jgi:hypothetical protein